MIQALDFGSCRSKPDRPVNVPASAWKLNSSPGWRVAEARCVKSVPVTLWSQLKVDSRFGRQNDLALDQRIPMAQGSLRLRRT